MREGSNGTERGTEITWADGALRLLARAGRMLNASLDYQSTLTALTRLLVPDFADACTIYLLDPPGEVVQVEVAHQVPEREVLARELLGRFPPSLDDDRSVVGRVLRGGPPVLVPEVDERFYGSAARGAEQERLLRSQGMRSVIVVPMRAHGQVIGAIGVAITESERIYDTVDQQLLEEVAARAAVAVEHARLYAAERSARRQAERAVDYAERLLGFTTALGAAATREEIARVVVEHGVAATGAKAALLAVLVEGGDALQVIGSTGYPDAIGDPAVRHPLESATPSTDAVRQRAPLLMRTLAERQNRYPHLGLARAAMGPGGLAAVPVMLNDEVLGCIGLSFGEDRDFPDEERTFLMSLARQCAGALDRVRVTERLAHREHELATISERAPDIITRYDAELRHIYVNPAMAAASGRDPSEYLGRTAAEVGEPPELVEFWTPRIRQVFETGEPVEVEFDYPSPRGTLCLESRIVPEFDAEGRVVTVLAVTRDVTEHRRAEAGQRQRQKMEAVSRLAGGVAHEVNNQMTVILGLAELMREHPSLDGPLLADVDEIRAAAERAARVSAQLLAFSRQQTVAPVLIDLNTVVLAAALQVELQLPPGVRLALDLGEALSRVRIDPAALKQAVLDLARNAVEAMRGDGTLTLRTGMRRLDAAELEERIGALARPGLYTELEVRDTGAGMDAATVARLFEPFFTTKEIGEGQGLGLATVYGVVKQHGGYVWAESEPGAGTSIFVLFPASDDGEG